MYGLHYMKDYQGLYCFEVLKEKLTIMFFFCFPIYLQFLTTKIIVIFDDISYTHVTNYITHTKGTTKMYSYGLNYIKDYQGLYCFDSNGKFNEKLQDNSTQVLYGEKQHKSLKSGVGA